MGGGMMGDGMGDGMMGSSRFRGMMEDDGLGNTMDASARAEAAQKRALRGRYVDASGKPEIDPDLTGQFRRMPVVLEFVADQRYISDILVNCANCPMPIDVLWVTINPDAAEPFEFAPSGGGDSGMSGGMRGGSSASGGIQRRSGGSGARSGSGGNRPQVRTPGRSGSSSGGGVGSGSGIIGFSPDRSAGMGGGRAGEDIDFGPDAVILRIYGCINIFAPPEVEKIKAASAGSSDRSSGDGHSGRPPGY